MDNTIVSDVENLRPKAVAGAIWEAVTDHAGIYCQSYIDKDKVEHRRTEWQDGWNAAVMDFSKRHCKLLEWLHQLLQRETVEELLLSEAISLQVGNDDKVHITINCNDLFYWACADSEDVEIDELSSLQECLAVCPKHGTELFASRKRGMRPQQPCYKYYDDAEKLLFDAAGPERDRKDEG